MNHITKKTIMKMMNNIKEVGGTHYEDLKYNPMDLFNNFKWNINWPSGEIIKYVSRFKHKNGKEDLEKALNICNQVLLKYTKPKEPENMDSYMILSNDEYIKEYSDQFKEYKAHIRMIIIHSLINDYETVANTIKSLIDLVY